MTLLKKSDFLRPFNEGWLTDFFDNERFFDADWLKRMQVVPAVNVIEKEKMYEIELAAPGLTKKDFNITLENGILTIACEKEMKDEKEEKNYTRKEYSYMNFNRSFTLPENVKMDKLDARYENGILYMMLPKEVTVKVKPKAIEVH
ncbi:MAG: Hsp20/alpha crystallin family protein [Flammeovirgaceae bacterium]|nr:Hsp20/alpha crystallin family protein [Flammeovirgaceae bacterium]